MHSISELKNAKLIILQVEDLLFYIPLLDERERERERGGGAGRRGGEGFSCPRRFSFPSFCLCPPVVRCENQ